MTEDEVPPLTRMTWVHCVVAACALSTMLWILFLLIGVWRGGIGL